MKFNYKHIVIIIFGLLLILILSSKTIWRVCTVCGVQDFERSLFGKKAEWISSHEVDEFGTYKKWKAENGTLCDHQWKLVEESTTNLLEIKK